MPGTDKAVLVQLLVVSVVVVVALALVVVRRDRQLRLLVAGIGVLVATHG